MGLAGRYRWLTVARCALCLDHAAQRGDIRVHLVSGAHNDPGRPPNWGQASSAAVGYGWEALGLALAEIATYFVDVTGSIALLVAMVALLFVSDRRMGLSAASGCPVRRRRR